MKYVIKFPDGREEKLSHSAANIEDLAVSGFGKPLSELQSEGFEITPIDEESIASTDVGDLNAVLNSGGGENSNTNS